MELSIPLTKSKFHRKTFTELINKRRVKELLTYELFDNFTNEHGFTTNEYTQLKSYLKKIRRNNANITYRHSKNDPKVGRVFAYKGLSLQMFRKDIRHFLVHDTYDDLDIVNCYFSILLQLCQANLKPNEYKHIEFYCNNREKCLSDLKCDRHKAKALYLMLLHGGTVQKWREKFNEPSLPVELTEFINEVEMIGKTIHNLMTII